MSESSETETEERVQAVQALIRVKDGVPVSEEEAIDRALRYFIDQHKVVERSETSTSSSLGLDPLGENGQEKFSIAPDTRTRPITDPFPEDQFDEL